MHIAPPLIISDDELRRGLQIIDDVLEVSDRWARGHA
jgi:taurine--2-oxoglutarate transaminase